MGEIVHKMMARLPANRYQHAKEITQDLKRVARVLKEDAAGTGRSRQARQRTFHATRRAIGREAFFQWSLARHATILVVAAGLVACGSAAVGWWLRPKTR